MMSDQNTDKSSSSRNNNSNNNKYKKKKNYSSVQFGQQRYSTTEYSNNNNTTNANTIRMNTTNATSSTEQHQNQQQRKWIITRVPTNHDAMTFTHTIHGIESWQSKTLKFLHQKYIQYTLIGLLLLDVLVLFFDLWLLAEYPNCTIITRDAISCCSINTTTSTTTTENNVRYLSSDESEQHHSSSETSFCPDPMSIESNYSTGCNPHQWEHVHIAENVFFYITIIVLFIFFIENIVEMIVLTPKIYFQQLFFIIDFFIISISIALEITFRIHSQEGLQTIAGLLVIGRIWRFVRISHGLVEVTAELASHKFHVLMSYTEQLEVLLNNANIPLPPNHSTIEHMRAKSVTHLIDTTSGGVHPKNNGPNDDDADSAN